LQQVTVHTFRHCEEEASGKEAASPHSLVQFFFLPRLKQSPLHRREQLQQRVWSHDGIPAMKTIIYFKHIFQKHTCLCLLNENRKFILNTQKVDG